MAIFWYQILLLPTCSCIHFQVWFYFTRPHFVYTEGVFAWEWDTYIHTYIHTYIYIHIYIYIYIYIYIILSCFAKVYWVQTRKTKKNIWDSRMSVKLCYELNVFRCVKNCKFLNIVLLVILCISQLIIFVSTSRIYAR